MMKDVTILTFDEVERIRHELDNMIDVAKDGSNGDTDAKTVCTWLINDLRQLRDLFE